MTLLDNPFYYALNVLMVLSCKWFLVLVPTNQCHSGITLIVCECKRWYATILP